MSVATTLAARLPRSLPNLPPTLATPAILAGALLLTVTAVVTLDLRGQIIFGSAAFLAVLALSRNRSPLMTLTLAFVSVAMGTRYLWWRITETLHFSSPVSAALGAGLFLAEVYAWFVMILGFPMRAPAGPAGAAAGGCARDLANRRHLHSHLQ
uniref:Uncharacterized protein n=1 Tax=Phenylobacterium glaciei TaxID=2803784 RepID=A0A974SAV4_9CAUL|nr:hypothetical protein JKL49_08030 [Phenylobacterium glaciei]